MSYEFIDFTPPPYTFPDLSHLFDMKKSMISDFRSIADALATSIKGFDKFHPVEVSLSGDIIHIQQFSGAYQAVFVVDSGGNDDDD